jgi:hypothetical protein
MDKLVMCTAVALAWAAGERAAAEVVTVAANGFEVRETAHTAAPSDKVYAALLLPAHWWRPTECWANSSSGSRN